MFNNWWDITVFDVWFRLNTALRFPRYTAQLSLFSSCPILTRTGCNSLKPNIFFSASSNRQLCSYTSAYTLDNPGYTLIPLTSKLMKLRKKKKIRVVSLNTSTKDALKEQSRGSSRAHLGSWGDITATSPHTLGHIHKNLRQWRQRNRTQSKGLCTCVCVCVHVHVCVNLAWLLRLSP